MLLAQIIAGYSIPQLLVLVIVIAAAIAIVYVVLGKMGVAIPPWVVQIFWIVVVAFVGIFAIYLVFSFIGRV